MIKKFKKGFTLIELVVVIAVIAILAAISVISYTSITNKAKESNDHMVIDQINTSLLSSQILEKKATVHEIVERFAEEEGYDVRAIKPELKNARFVYSYENGKFGYWKDNKVAYPADLAKIDFTGSNDLWFFEDEAIAEYKDSYSHYLKAAGTVTSITTNGGLDVGKCTTISSINFTRTTNAAKPVVIRTNSYDTALTVNAPLDTVHHYGSLMSANLQKVSSSSYYEHGDTNLVEIASGRLVITNDANAKVDNVYLTATNDNYKVDEVGIIIATQSGAKLPDVIRRDAVTETDGKVVCTIQTNVDANGENPQKVDNVTIKGEDNVQEATNGYTNVADLTKMVLEAPIGSEIEGASDFIGNDVAVATEEKQGVINGAKGTVIEVTFRGAVSLHTISEFRDLWNAGEFFDLENPASIKLTGNVDMKKIGNWGPIGTWEYPFFGTFNGNNKKISNLSNHANADVNGNYTHIYGVGDSIGYGETYGFFGIVGGGNMTISDISFINVVINIENGKDVGVVIGYVPSNSKFKSDGKSFANDKWKNNTTIGTNSLTLTNVNVGSEDDSSYVKAAAHVGGIVGKLYCSGGFTISGCNNYADVMNLSTSGGCAGIVGFAASTPTDSEIFSDCHNYGNLTSYANNGTAGIVGAISTSYAGLLVKFEDCSNEGNIVSKQSYAAGIFGYASCYVNGGTIKNCSNSGNITAENGMAAGIATRTGGEITITFEGTISNTGTISATTFAYGITNPGNNEVVNNATSIVSSGSFEKLNDSCVTVETW